MTEWQKILKSWIKQGHHVQIYYDELVDTLYVCLGQAVLTYSDEVGCHVRGYVLRYSIETNELKGMVVVEPFSNDEE